MDDRKGVDGWKTKKGVDGWMTRKGVDEWMTRKGFDGWMTRKEVDEWMTRKGVDEVISSNRLAPGDSLLPFHLFRFIIRAVQTHFVPIAPKRQQLVRAPRIYKAQGGFSRSFKY